MYFDKRLAENTFSEGMCRKCRKEYSKSILEDWRFDPTQGGDTVALDPHYGMSNLKQVDDDDNSVPKYKHTEDGGTKITKKMILQYKKKNAKNNAMRNIPLGV